MFVEIRKQAKDAMLKLIEAEREGEQIDRSLLKNVLAIFQEVRRRARLASASCSLCRFPF